MDDSDVIESTTTSPTSATILALDSDNGSDEESESGEQIVVKKSSEEDSDDSFHDAPSFKSRSSKSAHGSLLNGSNNLDGTNKISVSTLFESDESSTPMSNKKLDKGKKMNHIYSSLDDDDDDDTHMYNGKSNMLLKSHDKLSRYGAEKNLSSKKTEPVVIDDSDSENENVRKNKKKNLIVSSSEDENERATIFRNAKQTIQLNSETSTLKDRQDMSYRVTKPVIDESSDDEDGSGNISISSARQDMSYRVTKPVIDESSDDEDGSGNISISSARQDMSYRVTKPVIDESSDDEDESRNISVSSDSEDVEPKDSVAVKGSVECEAGAVTDTASDISTSLAEVKLGPSSSTSPPGPSSLCVQQPNTSNDYSSRQESLAAEEVKLRHQVAEVAREIDNIKHALKTANLATLPDRGVRMQMLLKKKEGNLRELRYQQSSLSNKIIQLQMQGGAVRNTQLPPQRQKMYKLPTANTDVHAMGQKALETHRVQQALTLDALRVLHKSLETRPTEDTVVADPRGLTCELMAHQRHGLAWLLWREQQSPSGGVLADDMGLGKTLLLISLVLKAKEKESEESDQSSSESENSEDEDNSPPRHKKLIPGNTLVVCPSTLLGQWVGEVETKVKRGHLSVGTYHGTGRTTKARRLVNYDIIVTTYSILQSEIKKTESPLYSIRFKRIILDEAHTIRNVSTQTAKAVFALKGKYRFALTGTPIHNKTADFYALVKFIKCTPFNDLVVWKRWVDNKDAAGSQRLNTITQAVMLRRTKEELKEKGELNSLTQRTFKIIQFDLNKEEKEAYEKLLMFSKSLFASFLHQQAEKKNALEFMPNARGSKAKLLETESNPFKDHPELARLHNTMQKIQTIKSHHILILLLRLRQFCCQPYLVNSMLEKEDTVREGIDDAEGTDIDIVDKIGRLSIGASNDQSDKEDVDLDLLTPENPVFQKHRLSTKMTEVMRVLDEILPTGDKVIIVSQWVSFLDILKGKLQEKRVILTALNGKTPVPARADIVKEFNRKDGPKVMLLSLTAGGVGLNLVGANHLMLVDLHWNPQLEAQACDRIYRVGQKKDVFIYKFIATSTIEDRVYTLQHSKLKVAEEVLDGKVSSKLSLADLKLLFEM